MIICINKKSKSCVEQIFDEKTNMISKNSGLSAEFQLNLKLIFDELEPQLSKL